MCLRSANMRLLAANVRLLCSDMPRLPTADVCLSRTHMLLLRADMLLLSADVAGDAMFASQGTMLEASAADATAAFPAPGDAIRM